MVWADRQSGSRPWVVPPGGGRGVGADRPIVINMTVRQQCILGVTKVIGVQCIIFSFPFVDICHWGLEDSEFVQGL